MYNPFLNCWDLYVLGAPPVHTVRLSSSLVVLWRQYTAIFASTQRENAHAILPPGYDVRIGVFVVRGLTVRMRRSMVLNAETCFTAYHAAYSYQKETLRSIAISDEKLEALVFRGCRNFLLSGAPKHVTAAATTPVATDKSHNFAKDTHSDNLRSVGSAVVNGNKTDRVSVLRHQSIRVRSFTNPHPDIPPDVLVFAQLIVDGDIVWEKEPMGPEQSGNSWKLKFDYEIPPEALTFRLTFLRKSPANVAATRDSGPPSRLHDVDSSHSKST
ncbi:hypothetical protein B0H13DRAFT_1850177 [Mycena leptocephala]|nr:hypothetical protein B0H13DRAFT_1850177 [Mycena leptocephala]